MQFLANYIMKGRIQAMTVAATFAMLSLMLPPVSLVSSAAVGLVTLRLGAKEGLFVLGSSCVAAALLGLLLLGQYQFALLYGLVLWLPVWLIAIVLREGRQMAFAVQITVLIGIAGIVGFYGYQAEPAAVWQHILNTMFVEPMRVAGAEQTLIEQASQQFAMLSHYMTGGVAAGSVSGLLLGLFIARWWQALLYNPGGFGAEFLALRGGSRLGIASVLVVMAALLLSGGLAELCWNIVVLLTLFYAFIGTAVLHSAFAAMKAARFTIPLLYLTLFIFPHMIIFAALTGLADTWLNLRNKLKSTGAKAL